MLFSKNGSARTSGRPIVSIALVMAVLVTLSAGNVLSQEVRDQKPKKPRFERTEMTLTDNKTGLVWALNANIAERQFSWSGTADGLDRIVNKERYAGFRDWRMPTKEELLTLVELAQSQGYDGKAPERSIIAGLASVGFQNVQDDAYWSSTENRYFAAEAWVVDMTDGIAAVADKALYFNLWPVRSAH